MRRSAASTKCFNLLIVLALLMIASSALGQGTSFTYQGRLQDGGTPADGTYDMEFKLFNTQVVGTGMQQGSTVALSPVQVTAGTFTVQLDFGACSTCFDGSVRFLEIAVKQTSGSTFTTLGPRQPLTSTPYAVRSLNATATDELSVACVNCVKSNHIQSVQGSQVTGNLSGSQISGAIPVGSVPAGSGNYIQNRTSQQAAADFNISGSGTVGGTLTVDGSTLVVVPTVNRVGIGTNAPIGKLHVVDSTGTNGSVILPNNAIAAAEILDEPGVASETGNFFATLNGTVQTLLSRALTAPTDGFVLVIGTCEAQASHTVNTTSTANFGVSDSATSFPPNQDMIYSVPAAAPSGLYIAPVTVHGLFSVVAGTHTFNFLALELSGNYSALDFQLTLLFVPTSYGTVTPTAPAMALRQSAQDFRLASDETPTQDATRRESDSTTALLEQTQQLLSQVKESQRAVAYTTTSVEALKAENAELRSRLERLESLIKDAKVNRDMMTHQREVQLGPK